MNLNANQQVSTSAREITTRLGEMWVRLTDEEKAPYKREFEKENAKYLEKLRQYTESQAVKQQQLNNQNQMLQKQLRRADRFDHQQVHVQTQFHRHQQAARLQAQFQQGWNQQPWSSAAHIQHQPQIPMPLPLPSESLIGYAPAQVQLQPNQYHHQVLHSAIEHQGLSEVEQLNAQQVPMQVTPAPVQAVAVAATPFYTPAAIAALPHQDSRAMQLPVPSPL